MTSAATLLDTFPVLLPTLELASVLTLRRVSVATQIGVADHLASYLQDLLRRYLPDPQSFLSALTFSSGYIVGSLAVVFLLRDAAFHPDGIDVVLPHSERFTAFLFHLLTVQHGRLEYHSNIRSLRVEAKRGVLYMYLNEPEEFLTASGIRTFRMRFDLDVFANAVRSKALPGLTMTEANGEGIFVVSLSNGPSNCTPMSDIPATTTATHSACLRGARRLSEPPAITRDDFLNVGQLSKRPRLMSVPAGPVRVSPLKQKIGEHVLPSSYSSGTLSSSVDIEDVVFAAGEPTTTAEKTSPGQGNVATPVAEKGKQVQRDEAWLDEKHCDRLEVFRTYACTTGPWFAVSMVPMRTAWEVINNNHKTTVLSFLGKPLTVWIVGELQSIVVYVGSVAANPVMRLALRLLADVDRISLADIERLVHRQHATPQSDTFRALTLAQTLNEIYDATEVYTAKNDMARLAVTDLRPLDHLLAECWFVRKELLGGWQTTFQITSIARLRTTPEDMKPAVSKGEFPWKL
ncbi:hypothetical protein VTO73DRAFT_3516 [Trametes versicolor]